MSFIRFLWWCSGIYLQCRRHRFNPGSGRSPGEGNGNPLEYSCWENLMDRGIWWATVHEVTKSQTQLSTHTDIYTCTPALHQQHPLNKWGHLSDGALFLFLRNLQKIQLRRSREEIFKGSRTGLRGTRALRGPSHLLTDLGQVTYLHWGSPAMQRQCLSPCLLHEDDISNNKVKVLNKK